MKKLVGLLIVVALCVCVGFISYRYLVIRDGGKVHFMEKNPGTFDRVYVDVTDWTPKDFMMNPGIAAFIAGKAITGTGDDVKEAVRDGVEKAKDAVEEGFDKAKESIEDGVEKLKEKKDK